MPPPQPPRAASAIDAGQFAQRMMALFQNRAQQQPLPSGFMRCPFDPSHHIPTAAIITHIEKVHDDEALALVPDAMYSDGTAARRAHYLRDELYADDTSSSSNSSSASSYYSTEASHRGRRHHRRHRRHDADGRLQRRHYGRKRVRRSSSSSRSSTPYSAASSATTSSPSSSSSSRGRSSISSSSSRGSSQSKRSEEVGTGAQDGHVIPHADMEMTASTQQAEQQEEESSSSSHAPAAQAVSAMCTPTRALTMSAQVEQHWQDRCVVLRRTSTRARNAAAALASSSSSHSKEDNEQDDDEEEEEEKKAVWRWLRAGECAPVDMIAQGPCVVLVFASSEAAVAARARLAEDTWVKGSVSLAVV